MRLRHLIVAAFAVTAIASAAGEAGCDELRVAVAANFVDAARAIASRFEERTGHRVILSPGSTGKHYAQIINGAPFDVFIAADTRRPELLEAERVTVDGSRFTYAIGYIVLWSPRPGYVDSAGAVLSRGDFRHLSIANPRVAPYGGAAREVLEALGLWERLRRRTVRGENIRQAYQFVLSGNAELGFIARSQLMRPGHENEGSWWNVPRSLYTPIEQQAVLLTDTDAGRAFLAFIQGDAGRDIIRNFGYGTP